MLEEPPDLAGDVALDAAGDLAVGLAFGASSSPVGDGVRVAARAGDGDDVERMVQLAIAVSVESMASLFLAGCSWEWSDACEPGVGGFVAAATGM